MLAPRPRSARETQHRSAAAVCCLSAHRRSRCDAGLAVRARAHEKLPMKLREPQHLPGDTVSNAMPSLQPLASLRAS